MKVIGPVGNTESTLQIPGLVPIDYESGQYLVLCWYILKIDPLMIFVKLWSRSQVRSRSGPRSGPEGLRTKDKDLVLGYWAIY